MKNVKWANFGRDNLIRLISCLLFSTAVALPLAGCGADGDGSPIISNLSTTVDATEKAQANTDSDSMEPELTGQESTMASQPVIDEMSESSSGLLSDSIEPDSLSPSSEEDPMIAMTPTTTGVTATLTWDPSSDADVTGYHVYYGKQPSGSPGSCDVYEESRTVEAPPATITGLDPNTPYFFSISAFNESESLCSIEIMVVTPPVKA